MTAGPDLVHNMIVEGVLDQIPRKRWARLRARDVDIIDGAGGPVPDPVVLGRDATPEAGRLLPSELITRVAEVVSTTGVVRDHLVERSIHAAGRVPAYLVTDPVTEHRVLLTMPVGEGDAADHKAQLTTRHG
ncbi:hypothetical protein [Streptomyces sp. NEAU-W12]|uniref:hypothetical protein n=1 Tax=Streptomyces sp. NEAU-W12 TaxID=2994668 RepID=UPI002B05C9F4|nr:hypothetical protein [Streptomyces sp. NEAU-W12]